ncbi:MAG: NADH-quinone oxidoreductase subunit J [Planctomycetota bacterium]
MFLFVIYALAVWFAAFRWRRQILGLGAVIGGVLLLELFNVVHGRIASYWHYGDLLVVFRVVMYPYMVLVAMVGIYLALLPKELNRSEHACRACFYDLGALVDEMDDHTPCPECGTTIAEASTRKGRRDARRRARARARVAAGPLPAEHADAHPERQHADRQPGHHQPA